MGLSGQRARGTRNRKSKESGSRADSQDRKRTKEQGSRSELAGILLVCARCWLLYGAGRGVGEMSCSSQ